MTQISDLPPEILSMVLTNLDSSTDLSHAIQASPVLARVFWGSPELHLARFLLNNISVAARRFALALAHLPESPTGRRWSKKDDLELYLNNFFENPRTNLPLNMRSLIEITLRQNRIKRFQEHYAALALRKGRGTYRARNRKACMPHDRLPWWAVMNPDPKLARDREITVFQTLSSSEKARLERGFYLHELLCKLFPCEGLQFSTQEQYDLFLARIPAFQVEEASCVHQYFMEISGRLFDQVENEFVQDAGKFPIVDHTIAWDGITDELSRFIHPLDTWNRGRTALRFFSSADVRSAESASYAASRGLDHCYQCLVMTGKDWIDQVCSSIDRERDFLLQALKREPEDGHPYPETLSHNEDPSYANIGWLGCMYDDDREWLSRENLIGGFCYNRDVGFVFWDTWRVQVSSFTESSQDEHGTTQVHRGRAWPRSCVPADYRLQGLSLSSSDYSIWRGWRGNSERYPSESKDLTILQYISRYAIRYLSVFKYRSVA